jgi:hypothetical protein
MERTYDATANRGQLARALAILPEKRCRVRCPQRINRSSLKSAALRTAHATAQLATHDRFKTMDLLTLAEIRRAASHTSGSAVPARVHVQVESANAKTQRDGKPYCELVLADACDRMKLRVWSDHPNYKTCSGLTRESFIELTGEFRQHPQFGLEADKWMFRPLSDQETKELLEGPPPPRPDANVRGRMGRSLSPRRSRTQISSRSTRRVG